MCLCLSSLTGAAQDPVSDSDRSRLKPADACCFSACFSVLLFRPIWMSLNYTYKLTFTCSDYNEIDYLTL